MQCICVAAMMIRCGRDKSGCCHYLEIYEAALCCRYEALLPLMGVGTFDGWSGGYKWDKTKESDRHLLSCISLGLVRTWSEVRAFDDPYGTIASEIRNGWQPPADFACGYDRKDKPSHIYWIHYGYSRDRAPEWWNGNAEHPVIGRGEFSAIRAWNCCPGDYSRMILSSNGAGTKTVNCSWPW